MGYTPSDASSRLDETSQVRQQVDRICRCCSHLSRRRVEQMIFEAGLPVVIANLEIADPLSMHEEICGDGSR